MKTEKQLKEMWRDLMGCKCVAVEIECVELFVNYCKDVHNLCVNGGALTNDGKRQYLYID